MHRGSLAISEREVESCREQVRNLTSENASLRRELSHDERDPQHPRNLIAYLSDEVVRRDAIIADLNAAAARAATAFDEETKRLAHDAEQRLVTLERQLDAAAYEASVSQAELTELRAFRASKQYILDDLAAVRDKLESTKVAHGKMVEAREKTLRLQVDAARAAYQERADHLERNARRAARERLSEETRVIVRENRRMGAELAMLFEANAELQARYDALAAKHAALNDEMRLVRGLAHVKLVPRPPSRESAVAEMPAPLPTRPLALPLLALPPRGRVHASGPLPPPPLLPSVSKMELDTA